MEKNPVLFEAKERPIEVDGRRIMHKKAIMNTDTNDVIGIVGTNYKVVDNKQILSHFGKIADELKLDWALIKGYLIRGGSKSIMEIEFPNKSIVAKKGDVLNLRAYLTNGFDGFSSAKLEFGFFRLVCSNGMIIGTKDIQMSYRHVGQVNERLIEEFRRYMENRIKESEGFVKDITHLEFRDKDDIETVIEKSDWVSEKYKANLITEWHKHEQALSLWTLYNVYTYVITHLMRINMENRLNLLKTLYRKTYDWKQIAADNK